MFLKKLIKNAEVNYFQCRRASIESKGSLSEMPDLNMSDVEWVDLDMNCSYSFDNISSQELEQEAEINGQNKEIGENTIVETYSDYIRGMVFDGSEFQDIITGPEDDCDLDDIIVTKLEDDPVKSAFSHEEITADYVVKNKVENKVECVTAKVHNTYLKGMELALSTNDQNVCCFSKNLDYNGVTVTETVQSKFPSTHQTITPDISSGFSRTRKATEFNLPFYN